jgi:hypothetical protein
MIEEKPCGVLQKGPRPLAVGQDGYLWHRCAPIVFPFQGSTKPRPMGAVVYCVHGMMQADENEFS